MADAETDVSATLVAVTVSTPVSVSLKVMVLVFVPVIVMLLLSKISTADQVTAVLAVPVTVAVICTEPPAAMLALAGVRKIFTVPGVATVTVACPDLVVSATLVAVTMQFSASAGAV